MIVDEADMEMEMATDPFIEAGIEVPPTLPYQDSYQKEESTKKVVGTDNPETVEGYMYFASLVDKTGKCWNIWGYGIEKIMTIPFNCTILHQVKQNFVKMVWFTLLIFVTKFDFQFDFLKICG